MGRHITILLLKTFCFSLLLTLTGTIIVLSSGQHHHHSCDMSGIAYGFAVFVPLFLTLSALPAYLNLYKTIRERFGYRWLSFYAFPILVVGAITGTLPGDAIAVGLMSIPFFCLLTWAYIRFVRRQTLKTKTIKPNYEM